MLVRTVIALCCSMVLLTMASAAQTAQVQIIHNCADPAAGVVDVYVNGEKALDDFGFRTSTPFISLPAGVDVVVSIAAPESMDAMNAIYEKTFNLPADGRFVVIASGVVGSGFMENTDPNASPIAFDLVPVGNVRATSSDPASVDLFAFHGATDAPGVDVLAGGSVLINGLSYGSASSYLSVPADSYVLGIAPTGGEAIAEFAADLSALGGSSIIVLASGFLDPAANNNGPAFGLYAATSDGGALIELPAVAEPVQALVQIIHNAADPAAAVVDVWVNDEKAVPDFAFRTATPFVALPANTDLKIGVAAPGSESAMEALATFDVNLPEGRYVVVANGVLAPDQFAANPDDRAADIGFTIYPIANIRETASEAGNVDLIAIHGSTDAPAVDVIANGIITLVSDLVYGQATGYASVPAAPYTLGIAPTGGEVIATFDADLTALAGNAIVVVASGFLDPSMNQNGAAFGLYAALSGGGPLVELPATTASVREDQLSLSGSSVMPNPSTTSSTITFTPRSSDPVSIAVVNAQGVTERTIEIGSLSASAQQYTISTSDLAAGAYYVTVRNGAYRSTLPLVIVK